MAWPALSHAPLYFCSSPNTHTHKRCHGRGARIAFNSRFSVPSPVGEHAACEQESPTRVTGAAGSKIDPIERRRRQSGLVGVREADHASRTRSEPSQDARSDGGREDNGGDTNTDNIGRTESFSWGGPWLESLAALPGEARATRGGGHDAGSTITMKRSPPASHPAAPEQGWSEEQPRRRLQDDGSCAVGDAFTVSSTLYRSANGCYQTIFEEDPYTFVSATFISDTTLAIAVGDRLVLPTSALGAPSSYDLPVRAMRSKWLTNRTVLIALKAICNRLGLEQRSTPLPIKS